MSNNYKASDVTVVICAYKECVYLEECIKSILNQNEKVCVKISTSTPNKYISDLAEKYNIEMMVNPNGGHVKDYNFALKNITTKLGVLAHQDDLLAPEYIRCCLKELNNAEKPIIAFTDYLEMHDNKIDSKPSMMIRIKEILTWPMMFKSLRRSRFGKRLLQRFGNPITHPSVMYVMREMPEECFREKYRASMDWDLWERLTHQNGEFVYVNKVLLYHRMNKENTTSVLLETTNCRYEEELEIFKRFWPEWIAKMIMCFYSKAQKFY